MLYFFMKNNGLSGTDNVYRNELFGGSIMSLLWMEYDRQFKDLADIAFQHEQASKPDYFSKMSDHTKKIVFRDTKYNIDFLYTAYMLDDAKVMDNYSRWLYRLMDSILKERIQESTEEYVIFHLNCICYAVPLAIQDPATQNKLLKFLASAKENIHDEATHPPLPAVHHSSYEKEIQLYLDTLLKKDMKKALYLMQYFSNEGIPLDDIYVEILAECMRRIGEMWQTAQITVDTEHYCTAVTQMAMAQLYPSLFSRPRKDRTLLCACPGTELHEMGARMVADIFENDGWDSIYLGAAVPTDALLCSIRENQPDLVALSVAMPQHLMECYDLVLSIKKEFPDLKIAVGGNAFRNTHEIWKKWPVYFYTEDARDLLRLANEKVE